MENSKAHGKQVKKVHIENGGCVRRGLDAARLVTYFTMNGCKIVRKPRSADIIVYLTCAFEESKKDACLGRIRQLDRLQGELIVLGCLPGIAESELRECFPGRYLSTQNLDSIVEFFPDFDVMFSSIEDADLSLHQPVRKHASSVSPVMTAIKSILPTRKSKTAMLAISKGCARNCSYCVIRFATGSLRSKPISLCVEEYEKLLQAGYRRFIISAEDVGHYGLDIGSSLPELLDRLSEADRRLPVKWEIQTMSPAYAIRYKERLVDLARTGKLTWFKGDIQSGNNRILKLMNRHYDVGEASDVHKELKQANPDLCRKSQFIVGFPSESESEFADTIRVMEELRLERYSIFPYSEMEGSVSSKLPNMISEATKMNRVDFAMHRFEDDGYKVRLAKDGLKIRIK